MKGRWPLLSVVAAVLICCWSGADPAGTCSLLRDTGLYETPAVYTELAFNDPGALPSALEKPSGTVKVSFGIHNVSYASRSYHWSILIDACRQESGQGERGRADACTGPHRGHQVGGGRLRWRSPPGSCPAG